MNKNTIIMVLDLAKYFSRIYFRNMEEKWNGINYGI